MQWLCSAADDNSWHHLTQLCLIIHSAPCRVLAPCLPAVLMSTRGPLHNSEGSQDGGVNEQIDNRKCGLTMQRITRCSSGHIWITYAADCNGIYCTPVMFKLFFFKWLLYPGQGHGESGVYGGNIDYEAWIYHRAKRTHIQTHCPLPDSLTPRGNAVETNQIWAFWEVELIRRKCGHMRKNKQKSKL